MASIKLENAARFYLETRLGGSIREAVEKYTGSTFRQHSSGISDGVEGFVRYYTDFVDKHKDRDIKIIRAIEDNNFVFLHCYQALDNRKIQRITSDFFRFDDTNRIVEHWDVVGPYYPRTASEHTSLDGPSKIKDNHLTEENRFIVTDMIKNVFMAGGDKTKIDSYISDREYTQHNLDITDGIENLRSFIQNPSNVFEYKKIILIVSEGNFVSSLCEVDIGGEKYAQADVFRINEGKIVENWSVTEPVKRYDVNSGKF